MVTFTTILLLILGLILIIKGGDWFVDAASWVAEKFGIPKLVVGATIVSLATTLPEILVSLISAANGQVDMAIGNAVGSVTANIGLIMAIAIIFLPGKITAREYRWKFILILLSAMLTVIGGLTGGITLPLAAVLISLVVIFFWDNLRQAKAGLKSAKPTKTSAKTTKKAKTSKSAKVNQKHLPAKTLKEKIPFRLAQFALGAAGIVAGAELLISSCTDLAAAIGVSERIISVTIIAIGTSLPELMTTVTAIIKREGSLGFGNILGASIIDISLIMPLCALISGQTLTIAEKSAAIDLPACLIVAAVAVIPTAITKKFSRWQGVLMLATYAVYMFVTCII